MTANTPTIDFRGKTLYRNESYSAHQKSAESIIMLIGKFHIGLISMDDVRDYSDWKYIHDLVHGYTHRITGLHAYIEESPDEQ